MKTNRIKFSIFILLISQLMAFGQQKSYFSPEQINIPFKKYVLDNGLTLIVHEDHKAPIVAVNVWYHVGSKNEKPGRTGFAHLFEHLMFNGSENFNKDYFKALEAIGATDLNGTTNNDRTNYFQNVPTAALDQVLFLESDRMGHLLGAIDQAKLDEQRGVVQNEKRQGENRPYGREWDITTEASFPEGHPYSWTVIGSMEDLDAATLDDVKEWFKTYYGPSNAVLCVAGDVKPDDVFERVKKYFGDIAPGPSLVRPEVDIAPRIADTRGFYEDNVPESKVVMVWNVPQWGTREGVFFDLASDILSSGKTSRLYKKLVYEDQIASSAYAWVYLREIAGNFYVGSNVKPGFTAEKVEQTLIEVLDEFLEKGPTQEELDRVKSNYFANFLKGIERIGGFGGKSDILASNQIYGGDPEFYKTTLKYVSEATIEDIHKACKKWLSKGKYTLVCKPFPKLKSDEKGVDRSKLPELGTPVGASFPELQKTTLKNGLNIILAKRKGVPTIVGNLIFNAGYATDVLSKPGLASLSMNLMDEGTKDMNSLEISERLQLLGARIYTGSDLDASYISFNTLKPTLEPTIDVLTDILLNPAFPEKEFERLKKEQLADIQREKAYPFGMVLRVFPKVLYGSDNAYGNPMNGAGYESIVSSFTLDEVKNFYSTWIKPNNATLVIVGDIEIDDLKKKLEKKLSAWKKKDVPKVELSEVKIKDGKKIYLVDRPESTQSLIVAGYLTSPYGQFSQPALTAMNNILGGDFVSRLNMNLREDKHWSYGAGSFVWDAKGQRPYLAYVNVQMDKTKESIQEIEKELNMIIKDKPITKEEFERVQGNMVLKLPGRWETNSSVNNSIVEMVKFNLKEDYFKSYDGMVRKLTRDELIKLSKQVIKPELVNWFVIGDKSKILDSLKELNYEIIEVDADGNPVK